MSNVDYNSPLYLQVRELVLSKIEDGEYLPGSAIPSDNELAETLGINRLTIRNALEELVKRGVIKRVHGKGSYVVGKKITRDLERLEGFMQTMDGKNVESSVKVLKKFKRKTGAYFASVFSIDPDDDIYYVERLCFVDGEVMSLEEIFVPAYVVPKLEGIDLSVFSLYEVYQFYGVKLKEAVQTLELVTLDKKEAKFLDVTNGSPIMMVECITSNEEGRVIEFSRNYTRGDRCEYTVQFRKKKRLEVKTCINQSFGKRRKART